jgi:diadenosine tetraphosphate (Ap4A) HIT family hydrolase
MYYHTRKTRKLYNKNRRADPDCTFCENVAHEDILRETAGCFIVENRTPYDMWEHHQVLHHLMVIPKRHVQSLHDLPRAELLDAMRLCAEYEAAGYNIYARATGSPRRSVFHQHTHLIKLGPGPARAGIYLKKPYFHISF